MKLSPNNGLPGGRISGINLMDGGRATRRILRVESRQISGTRVFRQADIGVQRTFRVTERAGLRFRGEFFNIFNHPNFANPTNSLTSSLFGRSTQMLAKGLGSGGANGGFNPLYQIGGPRSIQLALKLQF